MSIQVKVACISHIGLQTSLVLFNGARPHEGITVGYTDIDIATWLAVKAAHPEHVSMGIISVSPDEEAKAIKAFQTQCFSDFEAMGIPAVKSALATGELAKSVKLPFATEWLEGKNEARIAETISISRDANSIARKSLIVAIVALAVAIIAAYISVKIGK